MKCHGCGSTIGPGEEREHLGRLVCEDCYMKVLSPVRTCDPWAVYSAKSFEKHSGGPGTLTPIQANILSILKKTGGMAPPLLLAQLGGEVTPEQLEREFAALRHMEKVRAEKRGQHLVWRPW